MDEEKRERKRKQEEAKQRRLQERAEEKIRKDEEKAKKKADKERIAKIQRAEKELNSKKRLINNPDHSIKLMKLNIDKDLEKFDFYSNFLREIDKNELKYTVESQVIPQSITWTRNAEEYYINENQEVCSFERTVNEHQMIVIWSPEEIVKHVANDTFISAIRNITSIIDDKNITLVIYKIEDYFKSIKNQKVKEPGK